jgi:hypothetical protein
MTTREYIKLTKDQKEFWRGLAFMVLAMTEQKETYHTIAYSVAMDMAVNSRGVDRLVRSAAYRDDDMQTVTIEIMGGSVKVSSAPAGINVKIINHDNQGV